jgi:hypothetical protein
MSRKTDDQYPKANDTGNSNVWYGRIYKCLNTPVHAAVSKMMPPDKTSRHMDEQLRTWCAAGTFHYVENRSMPITFSMDWVKHVFFGHTHVKFNSIEKNGILYHNTGAMDYGSSGRPSDLGILEAELHEDGKIRNVQPVNIEKDATVHTVRSSPPFVPGR